MAKQKFERTRALEAGNLGDGSRQGCFAVVNVTDGTNVDMGFCAFVLCLAHSKLPQKVIGYTCTLLARLAALLTTPYTFVVVICRRFAGLERETGFEPATLSLEG